MRTYCQLLLTIFSLCCSGYAFAQTNTYIRNGSATQNNCNCYTLTQPVNNQSGSVWNATKINLNNSFDFIFNVNLGCADGQGADGIVFILQPISTSIGTSGGGMGFAGVAPSIGIALDTWQNTDYNDPAADHISIQANGNLNHNSDLAGPVEASPISGNIEDCGWHTLRITWDAGTKWLRGYFDNSLRVEVQRDLITTIFNNDPMVYWGFSAATGGSYNLQQFCTALNPKFSTNYVNNATCIGQSISFQNLSQSFAPIISFHWDFGDGSTTSVANPPPHIYTVPGKYEVKLAITGFDGCKSDTLKTVITIADVPKADFQIFDTCSGKPPRVSELSTVIVGSITEWKWELDGSPISTSRIPALNNLSAGSHQLKLTVKSNYSCESSTVTRQFVIKNAPVVEIDAKNGCVHEQIGFNGVQIDNLTNIDNWSWTLTQGVKSIGQTIDHVFNTKGNYPVQLMATASNGCNSALITKDIFVNEAIANAGNDTVFLKSVPFQLNGSGGAEFLWTPSTGLSDPEIAKPTGSLSDDAVYRLKVTTEEGCTDEDDIHISIFKGSAIYVPTGFTPNGNGRNELLIPYYVGIKTIARFSVFNRWGQLIFTTHDALKGWDGRINGSPQPSGVYVWVVSAIDYVGKKYDMKGTTMLIR